MTHYKVFNWQNLYILTTSGLIAIPFISLMLLYSFILHARIALSHLQSSGKQVLGTFEGLLSLHDLVSISILITVYFGSKYFVMIIFLANAIKKKKIFSYNLIWVFIGYGLWWSIYFIDPGAYIKLLLNR